MTDRATPSHPIRVGIIGTGFAAECHADGLRRLPSVALAGVASRTRERALEAARRLGAERAFADPMALIDDPEIDAVHVCTINRLHSELSAAALKAGKHVVTEKPLATNSESTAALAAAADKAAEAGTLSAVCFNYRHYPLIQQLRAILSSGEYGHVHFVHGSYLQDWLLYETDWNWRLDQSDNGPSRAVADIGSHWIDLVQHVSGQSVTAVCADLATHHAVRRRPAQKSSTFSVGGGDGKHELVSVDSDDFGTVMVRFSEGARGAFSVSQVSPGRKNHLTFQVDTSDAGFAWDQEHPDTVWVGRRHEPNLQYLRDPAQGIPLVQLPPGHPEGWRDALRNMFADFYSAVTECRDGGPKEHAFATFADGHRTTLLVESIVESDRTRGWVTVADREPTRV